MSRLRTRLERLEQTVDTCSGCPARTKQIELAMAEQAHAHRQPDLICPNCGEQAERLTILVAFDPNAEAEDA